MLVSTFFHTQLLTLTFSPLNVGIYKHVECIIRPIEISGTKLEPQVRLVQQKGSKLWSLSSFNLFVFRSKSTAIRRDSLSFESSWVKFPPLIWKDKKRWLSEITKNQIRNPNIAKKKEKKRNRNVLVTCASSDSQARRSRTPVVAPCNLEENMGKDELRVRVCGGILDREKEKEKRKELCLAWMRKKMSVSL